jgi:amidophosphoribosyltransferase
MSEEIKHECGIALIRLKKDLSYYHEKYDSSLYGLNKLYLLMEKQHNRGQDGAGVVSLKLDAEPGVPFIFRERSDASNAISIIFNQIHKQITASSFIDDKGQEQHQHLSGAPFVGELMLGHLRYATYSSSGMSFCHPFIRENNRMSKNLVLAGNFNLTNNDELFEKLIELGQHPLNHTDTITVMEKIGHFLDEEVDNLYLKNAGKGFSMRHINNLISNDLLLEGILQNASKNFDGGYVMAGLIGHGDAFVLRDPNGIRPAFWYEDDEMVVVTSERPPIKTAFNVDYDKIQAVKPGHALIIRKDGTVSQPRILPEKELKQCSFERIYFSRGTDKDIYKERKELGRLVAPSVLKAIDYDLENTVFSYIPNTAEVSYIGMMEAIGDYQNQFKKEKIKAGGLSDTELNALLSQKPRSEKIAVKDAKLRTFITTDDQRKDLVSHVYDTTYGVIRPGIDNLVVIDDSIVRGTTLRNSILRILDRLGPKKIIIVSSAPQIRFPDCYGIDMSKMADFIAFKAAIALMHDHGKEGLLQDIYLKCKENLGNKNTPNIAKAVYEGFSDEQISVKTAEMLKSESIKAEVQIIYQTVEDLHKACPDHTGDWYFTGDFPTPGGNRVAIRSFVNFMENVNERAY